MYPLYFNALLKQENGELMEKGFACTDPENQSIDFKSAFVPLMKMGTVLKVVQVANGQETRCFTGEVYLSAGNFMRLIHVTETILTPVEKSHAADISIPARILPIESMSTATHLNHKKSDWLRATVYSVSLQTVKFTSEQKFFKGQKLLLQTEEPVLLRKTVLEVYQTLLFGDKLTGHLCNIRALPEPYLTRLTQYVHTLTRSACFFPQDQSEKTGS